VLAAASFGLVTSLLSATAPVIEVARSHKALRLAEHSRGTTTSTTRQHFRGLLVSTEIALAFLLVAGAGIFLSSLRQLQTVDPGFKTEGVLTGSVTLNASNYRKQPVKVETFLQNVNNRLSQQPGVVAVGAVFPLPFINGFNPSESFEIQDRPKRPMTLDRMAVCGRPLQATLRQCKFRCCAADGSTTAIAAVIQKSL